MAKVLESKKSNKFIQYSAIQTPQSHSDQHFKLFLTRVSGLFSWQMLLLGSQNQIRIFFTRQILSVSTKHSFIIISLFSLEKVNINKVMKKTKFGQEEINEKEEVYYNSDSESNMENNQSNTNQQINSDQQPASCDNQSNNQIYQDSPKSTKQKASSQSELDEQNPRLEQPITKQRKKNSKNSSNAQVSKTISKKNNQKQLKKSKQQRGDQCFFVKKDDHHDDDERLTEDNLQITQKNMQNVIDKVKQYLNEMFDSEFFEEVAEIVNRSIFEKKYTIFIEDIKQFTAFLLQTSNLKVDRISNYFNNPFLQFSNIISIELFFFISSCLASKIQNLHELSNLLTKKINSDQIEYSSFSEISSQSQQLIQNPELIKSNYLDFFSDYIFDFYNKTILINPSYLERSQPCFSQKEQLPYFLTNQSFSSIQIHEKKVDKVSFKLLRDQILLKKPVFSCSGTQLKSSPTSIPDLLYDKQINNLKIEQEEEAEENDKNGTIEDTKQYSFNYNPKTLQLVSIQQVELNSENIYNGKVHSKSKQNKKISTQEVFQIDISNPNPNNIQQIIFQDTNDTIYTVLLKIYNKYRPLTNIKLDEMESFQLRAYSEIVYSMCISTFQKALLEEFKTDITRLKNNYSILEQLFKDVLNLLTQSIVVIKKLQIQTEIIVQRHSLQKKKHCNFCLVCKYNNENKDEMKTNEEFKNEDNIMLNEQEQNSKTKKTKYECMICSCYYKRTISVCVDKCDEEFHKNPTKYVVGRSKKKKYSNTENMLNKIDQVGVGKTLEQLDQTEKILEEVVSKVKHDRIIAIDSINKPQNDLKSKKYRKKYEYKMNNQNNQIYLNEVMDKVLLRLPDQLFDPDIQEEKDENHHPNSQNDSEDADPYLHLQDEQIKQNQLILNLSQVPKIEHQFIVKQEKIE
ncbi:hypothetical protein TTHERM_00237460 (macronuclear) [Tetrahymena thermophila SB210]|uniref:Uncharacterized protein n=1 Tax=Tetrahymena thermophila (strain SB210) TaxID=312017 RepID=I7LXF3_TETTS|nr:hypothetical protein TTHERM_00237460 [Tetrahymena thermophila SB210]EAS04531.2 hypothetical protein TTHERM_00237460 [Tetrahymena thermophila SB210]|eukprot:XP_001024776.2 hypothetical protein TTHERM_00237460 [Tetrahymena thermophila SB210]